MGEPPGVPTGRGRPFRRCNDTTPGNSSVHRWYGTPPWMLPWAGGSGRAPGLVHRLEQRLVRGGLIVVAIHVDEVAGSPLGDDDVLHQERSSVPRPLERQDPAQPSIELDRLVRE